MDAKRQQRTDLIPWLNRTGSAGNLVNAEILNWSACNHMVNCGGTMEISPGRCMVWVQRTSLDSEHNALLARTSCVLTLKVTVSHLPRGEELT